MQDFVFFLGRFHVLALHLPIGIVIAAVVLDWLARHPRHAALAQASPFLWGAAAISAVFTAALGYLHFAEGGFTGPSADAHRLWGTVTAVAAIDGWWLSRNAGRAGALRLAAGIVMLALVSVTGHYGGNLTHGTTFLHEYAPSFLRSLIGAAPRRPPVTSVAAADPYHDVVQPLLEQRCGTCHNDDKREGGFSVGNYDSTLVGGDTGRAFVSGNVEASEALYRVSLPPDDDAFMPAEGKTPLTAEQVAILRWWVVAGTPRDTTVGALEVPAEIEPLLAAELGVDGTARAPTASAGVRADPKLVANLMAAGLIARQASQTDPRLVVSVGSPGTPLAPAALEALAAAAGEIVDLNLAGTALDDAGFEAIGALPAATHLRLARNALTDEALAALESSPQLEHLNLYGNAGITDSSIETLAALGALREVFLWQTGVTDLGAARLRALRPGLTVDMGATKTPLRDGG
ncbi:MAG TPA: c-type cytochrome domain-containing protein [Gammaproteobacteria bacterium]|nr:c-type cytochrome domain-containing protein [Gammaproteobacteria bacterium]